MEIQTVAKNKTKKIITAGLLVIEAIYPRADRRDDDRVRAAKRKASSEAQKYMNAVHSWQKLELQLAANYSRGDLWVTVTYDDAHLPKSRKEAELRFKYFRACLQAERKKRGQEAVVHWNTEHKHEHEDYFQHKRWHHHFVLNATGADYDLIRKCWIYGSNIEIRPLKLDKEHTFEALARYMCKEARDKVGQRCWSYTRNAKHPEVDTIRVENDEQVQVPKGALELQVSSYRDVHCSSRVIKYLVPGWDSTPKYRAKRRGKTKKR